MRKQKVLSATTECNKIKIAPSVLSADFGYLGEQVKEVVKAGADYIHIDVMDGHFVPNISIGIPVVEAIRRVTDIPLDVHLMIEKPETYIKKFADAGANILTVHVEACVHLDSTIASIKKLGVKAGVSLNPSTSLSTIEEVLTTLDMVLIMSVNPGFGGQKFIPGVLDKIARLRQIFYNRKIRAELEVDGGITKETASTAVKAGANVLVAGSAIFNSSKSIKAALIELRESLC